MKIFAAAGLACVFAGIARGQTEAECSLSSLSDAAVEQLAIYDKGLYLEDNCINGFTPMPVHCNYMGLGQACRGCFNTCEGAMAYVADFSDELAVWGVDAVIHFCPLAEVENLADC